MIVAIVYFFIYTVAGYKNEQSFNFLAANLVLSGAEQKHIMLLFVSPIYNHKSIIDDEFPNHQF